MQKILRKKFYTYKFKDTKFKFEKNYTKRIIYIEKYKKK